MGTKPTSTAWSSCFPTAATLACSATWMRHIAWQQMKGGLVGREVICMAWFISTWEMSPQTVLPPFAKCSCFCSRRHGLCLVLERTGRMGREWLSLLKLVSIGKEPHQHLWIFKSRSEGSWILVLPHADKNAVLYAGQHLQYQVLFWATHYQKDNDVIKWVQTRSEKLVKILENRFHEEQLR